LVEDGLLAHQAEQFVAIRMKRGRQTRYAVGPGFRQKKWGAPFTPHQT
jgi:hypothetical protein